MFRSLIAVSLCALTGYSTSAEDRLPQRGPALNGGQPLMPAVRGILDNLPGASGAVSRLTNDDQPGLLLPLLEKQSAEPSATLVQVRLSDEYLNDFLERDVDRRSQVRETILGTNISGTATTQGKTTLALHSSDDKAVIEVLLQGTVAAQMIGHHGPVQLHCSSHSPFESRKLIHLQSGGIKALPATSTANTRSTAHQIRSTLPGLRGRIAERIARGRVHELRSQTDAIASRNTERRLNAAFDQTVEKALANARGAVQSKLVSLPIGKLAGNWQYRSRPDYVEMVLVNPAEMTTDSPPVATDFETDAAIAVRIHRSAVRGALTSAELRESLRPLLVGLLSADKGTDNDGEGPMRQVKEGELSAQTVSTVRTPEFRVAWSEDHQWLEFHFSPDAPKSPEEAAAKLAVTER